MTSQHEWTISICFSWCTQKTFTCLNAFTHCITRNPFMSTQCVSGHHVITWCQPINKMNDLTNSTPPFELHSLIKLYFLTIFLVLKFLRLKFHTSCKERLLQNTLKYMAPTFKWSPLNKLLILYIFVVYRFWWTSNYTFYSYGVAVPLKRKVCVCDWVQY